MSKRPLQGNADKSKKGSLENIFEKGYWNRKEWKLLQDLAEDQSVQADEDTTKNEDFEQELQNLRKQLKEARRKVEEKDKQIEELVKKAESNQETQPLEATKSQALWDDYRRGQREGTEKQAVTDHAELSDLRERARELEEINAREKYSRLELQTNYDKLQRRLERRLRDKGEIERLEVEVRRQEDRYNSLQEKLDLRDKSHLGLQDEVKKLEEKLSHQEADQAQRLKKRDDSHKEEQANLQQYQDLQNYVRKMESEMEGLKTKMVEQENQAGASELKAQSLQEELLRQSNSEEQYTAEIEKLKQELQNRGKQVTDSKAEIKVIEQKLRNQSELNDEVSQLQLKLQDLIKQDKESKAAIQRVVKDKLDLKQASEKEIQALRDQLQKQWQRGKESQAEIKKLEQSVQDQSGKDAEFRLEIEQLRQKIEIQEKMEAEAKDNIQMLQRLLQDQANAVMKSNQQEARHQGQLQERDNKISAYEKEILSLQKGFGVESKTTDAKIQKLQEEVVQERKLKEAAKNQALEAVHQLDDLSKQRMALKTENEGLVELTEKQCKQLKDHVDEANKLRQLAENMKKEEADLERKLKVAVRQLDDLSKQRMALKTENEGLVELTEKQCKQLKDHVDEANKLRQLAENIKKEEIDQERKLKEAAKNQALEAVRQLDDLSKQQMALKTENKGLVEVTETQRTQLKDHVDEANKLRQLAENTKKEEADKSSQQIGDLQSRIDTQLKQHEDQMKKYAHETKVLQDAIQKKDREFKGKEAQIREHNALIQEMNTKIQEKDAEIEKLNQQRADDAKKNQDIQSAERQTKDAELKKEKQRSKKLEEDIVQYKEEITEQKLKLEQGWKELEDRMNPRGDGSIAEWQKMVREQEKKIADLELHLSKQEGEVMEAQEEAMNLVKTREELRHKFPPDSFIRSEIYASLQYQPEEWAQEYAVRSFTEGSAREISTELRGLWEKVIGKGKDPESVLSRYKPHVVLTVLLVQYIIEQVMKQPFLRLQADEGLPTGKPFATNVRMLYDDFLKADETLAYTWRSQTLQLLSERVKMKTETQKPISRMHGTEEFPFSDCYDLASSFINGPAGCLLKPLKNTDIGNRLESLGNLIKQAAWVSFMLWRQRAKVEFSYSHHLDPKKNGAKLDMIVQPSIIASWFEDGKSQTKVWGQAVELYDSGKVDGLTNVDDTDSDSDSDEDDESRYPDSD